MKTFKLIIIAFLAAIALQSCVIEENNYYEEDLSLDALLQSSDLWYIDYNQTTGSGDTRFMSVAFTLSFQSGKIYANNNLVGIGSVGNGYGDQIGYYNTDHNILKIDHDLDGYIDFEVSQINNKLRFYDLDRDVSYTLIPYSIDHFDFDKVFYDNIEYFLQEYEAWEKTDTYDGVENAFDNENFLAFIPTNINTFKSSQDESGTTLFNVLWDFEGTYEVFDITGTDVKKDLVLDYGNESEFFELSIVNDGKIKLYHKSSGTYYIFNGRENIVYKRELKKEPRKRFKVKRQILDKK